MTVVAFWLRGILLLVFAEAFVAHLKEPRRLERTIEALGLGRARPLARFVTVGDVLVAALLALFPLVGGLATLIYLAIVTLPLASARRAGRVINDCGCGSLPKPVDNGLLIRNALLAGAAGLICLLPQPSIVESSAWVALALILLARLLPLTVRR